jgi:hypothetical protein
VAICCPVFHPCFAGADRLKSSFSHHVYVMNGTKLHGMCGEPRRRFSVADISGLPAVFRLSSGTRYLSGVLRGGRVYGFAPSRI